MGKLKIYEMPLGFFKIFSKRNKTKSFYIINLLKNVKVQMCRLESSKVFLSIICYKYTAVFLKHTFKLVSSGVASNRQTEVLALVIFFPFLLFRYSS